MLTQTIDWKPDALTAGLRLADSAQGDFVRLEELGAARNVQIARPLKSAAAKPRNRRNQLGRRVFVVTYPAAASVEDARNAAEALEDSIRDFTAVASIIEWVYGAKLHTFSDASLESVSIELLGLTMRARFSFVYGEKETTDVAE